MNCLGNVAFAFLLQHFLMTCKTTRTGYHAIKLHKEVIAVMGTCRRAGGKLSSSSGEIILKHTLLQQLSCHCKRVFHRMFLQQDTGCLSQFYF